MVDFGDEGALARGCIKEFQRSYANIKPIDFKSYNDIESESESGVTDIYTIIGENLNGDMITTMTISPAEGGVDCNVSIQKNLRSSTKNINRK